MSKKTAASIDKSIFTFLKDLGKNNNREWFEKNRSRYEAAQERMVAFADDLLLAMRGHDHIENPSGKKSLFRIYRDVRFSKDKSPYKSHFSGYFRRATRLLRGGYYYHIEPGNSFAAGGFWGPNADDLQRIRTDIDLNYPDWKKMLAHKALKKTFGPMEGESLVNPPRGFEKDHPALDLLRMKQFLFVRKFSDKEVLDPGFVKELNATFKNLRPFFDYMSEVLTTDPDGHPLYETE